MCTRTYLSRSDDKADATPGRSFTVRTTRKPPGRRGEVPLLKAIAETPNHILHIAKLRDLQSGEASDSCGGSGRRRDGTCGGSCESDASCGKATTLRNARAAGRDLVSYLRICETDGACRNRTKRQKLHFEAARCSLVRRSHREKVFFFYVRLEFNSKPPLFESANYPIGV